MMSNGKLQNELNAVAVTVADLREAGEAIHALPLENRDWQGRAMAMVRLFKGQPNKSMAVECRLTAMSRMLQSGTLPGWSMPPSSDGSVNVAEPVWIATATEPLVLEERDAHFDPASFLNKVLLLAKAEGNA